jgi:hypothetical protein
VHEPAVAFEEAHIDVGVVALVFLDFACAYLEDDGVLVGSILQMMAIMDSGLEAGAISGTENLFSRVRDQHELALEHVHELIFGGMPMPLAGPGAGLQAQEVDSEVGQPGGIPDSLAPAPGARVVEWGGVAGAGNHGHIVKIDSFCHAVIPLPRKLEFAVI